MDEFSRGRLAGKYIFFEMLPTFLLGVIVFVLILLMFQALRLTEFVLVHGVRIQTMIEMVTYMSVSFLPVILPMSMLFAILLTYGRMSMDSEIVAMKSVGLGTRHLYVPALILSICTAVMSAETGFFLAPWGNRSFELLINEISRQRVGATIREGVFSEGFFNLVVYANEVESNAGLLRNVFIYDERDPNSPLTIIAKEGQIITDRNEEGHLALLRLSQGNIHRTNDASYTKVDFSTYDINLFDPFVFSEKKKSLPSYTIKELSSELKRDDLSQQQRTKMKIEFHRRSVLAVACLVFSLVGVGFGTTTNRRSAKASGFVLCVGLIIGYWILYITCENMALKNWLPTWLSLWFANILFLGIGLWSIRRSIKT